MTYLKTMTVPWIKKCCNYFPPGNNYLKFLLLSTLFFTLSSFDFHKNNKGTPPKHSTINKKGNPGYKTPFVGGDFTLDFTAAEPTSYNHATGGGAYDDRTINTDVVESLEGGDFKCGDIVTFLTQIRVDPNATGSQTIAIGYSFTTDATGQTGVGLCTITKAVINYGVIAGGVGDGSGGTDAGISDDGGSTANLTITDAGTCWDGSDPLEATVTVDDLEAGEKVVVRVDVQISCKPGSHPTGNLQANITGAEVTAPDDQVGTINVGSQTIPFKNVQDIEQCTFTASCPSNPDKTFDCTNIGSFPSKPTTIDDLKNLGFTIGTPCGTVQFTVSDDGTPNVCSSADQTITRTIVIWDDLDGDKVLDDNETRFTCKIIYTIKADLEAPTVKTPPGANKDLGCNPDPYKINDNFTPPTFEDNCGLKPVTYADVDYTNGCTKTRTRTWTAEDNCGHKTTASQKLTWTVDTQNPTVKTPPGANKNLGCNPYDINSNFTAPTFQDNCGLKEVTYADKDENYGCTYSRTRTWTAVDNCGNKATASQKLTWTVDTQNPTMKTPPGANKNLGCNPDPYKINYNFTAPTFTDNCGLKSVTYADVDYTNGCTKSRTRTWTAEDNCGHKTTASQKLTWTVDTQNPTVKTPPGANKDLGCNYSDINSNFTAPTFTDNCGLKSVTYADVDYTNGCTKSRTRTWTAVDNCGNKATASQKLTWSTCCVYCTYTQGYWGNTNGLSKLPSLLTTELVIGNKTKGYSVIIPVNNSTTKSASKLNNMMPGGGTPAVLSYGNCYITDNYCISKYLKNGRFNNVLLSQTITLSLNVRLTGTGKGNLASFPIQNGYITTEGGGCRKMNSNVVKYLTANGTKSATVSDLLKLANDVLGRVKTAGSGGVPSLSDINDAIDAINNAFDGCRKFTGYKSSCPTYITFSATEEVKGVQQGADLKVDAYPNPFKDRVQFVIHSSVSGKARLELFSLLGQKVATVYDGEVSANKAQTVTFNAPLSHQANLIYRLTVGDRVVTGKLFNIR